MKDFTFSDGTFIPKGTMVSSVIQPMNEDEDIYENPTTFDPWRFSRARKEDGNTVKHSLVTPGLGFLSFGHGRHAWLVQLFRETAHLSTDFSQYSSY